MATTTAAAHGPGTAAGATTTGATGRWGRDRLLWWLAAGVVLVGVSVWTVLRRTQHFLQADGVQQSVMSVQDVDLFFWGQNRFFAFTSVLAQPFADPDVNLFVCLLVNALAFHVLLLLLAWMGVRAVTGSRDRWATAVLFGGLLAGAHLLIAPVRLHILALESQPYSLSWSMALGSFLLWKRRSPWALGAAVLLVGPAAGLNPSVVLVVAFLAVVEMVRRRQWVRWLVLGAVWLAWLAVWQVLSARFGGTAGPIPDAEQRYFAFDLPQFLRDTPLSLGAVTGAFRPLPLVLLAVVSGLAVLALAPARRAALLQRLALAGVFCALYWAVFTGNPWVAVNGYPVRYFYPVVLFLVVLAVVPVVALAVGLVRPEGVLRPGLVPARLTRGGSARAGRAGTAPGSRGPLPRAVPLVGAAGVLVVALAGPLVPPERADVLTGVRATGDFVQENDVTFLAGYYWDMWPLLHETLDAGRDATYVTGFKSGGDPVGYRAAFERELAEGDGPPLAVCVNEDLAFCLTYLDFWTQAGWRPTGETCPVPGTTPQLGSPPVRQCLVLEYAGAV
ncbi:hypothetical protein [Cellulomonas marina]|uniref:Dolichyl-phosphate-mannose-protein mannosyltransferase n=1 Tax=Cellulomonas marina TaxID=988821 RepID=A0A1I0UY65_9CELL|nr:hypothetical protein [Cellulomonas marina]GIG29930.1 hypothetical protein Cma02nite_25300 [Cellulomonas marina]SFA69024.1 hypothetical protein SAMN05421867_1017 [Cellulomonas marina]